MKCDNCINQIARQLGWDEGGWCDLSCKKGHWDGGGNVMKEGRPITPDPWADCKDFETFPLHEAEEFKL